VTSLRVGLLGYGNVGAALVELIEEERKAIASRIGIELHVTKIAVRSTSKDRAAARPGLVFTTDARTVVDDPEIEVIVEVIGGIEPARALMLRAFELGKPVVTANKELLANHGAELYAAADAAGVDLLFEAAVCGAIPLVRPLRESLVGEPVQRVMGIVNGTTNYILTRMSEAGASYAEALAEAQSLGFAESDPTADVDGYDAGAKAAIIATIAFGAVVVAADVYHEGISGISAHDIEMARRLGYVIKAIAVVERANELDGAAPEIAVRVHPAMIPTQHPLASVRESFNAVFVEGGAVGELMFFGRGAGGRPTASAVLGDLIDASVNKTNGATGRIGILQPAIMRSIDDVESAFYIALDVIDRPGVLARVADVFGRHGVSIRSVEQEGMGDDARLIFVTHRALERDAQSTLVELRDLDVVRALLSVIRVVGDEDR
jgi:homoserine dehydrogenase